MVPMSQGQANKRMKTEAGYVKKFVESNIPQTLSNLQGNAQPMSGGAGSGNAAGLRETPVDIPDWKHPVSRGPADYTFATLPYYKDRLISTTRTGVDHGFRMTSPYDPEITNAAATDLNTNVTGTATFISVEASDASDTTATAARWFDFYSTMYNYYHVLGCRWHLTVQNLKTEPIWLHWMYYNDEVPPLGATNEDMQCWNDTESHLIGPIAHAVTSSGFVETNERNVNVNNVEGAGTSGNTPNYESTMVETKANNILKISGQYRPGQKRRQIHLDSEVENWTAVTANPALPEKLLLRFKPVWNAIDTNDANAYERDIRVHYTFRIEYLVEFKELKTGLRWPVERQPVTAAIVNNIEEDEE
uniref:Capsid protein n=1 Tax=Pavo cristatus parvoviridae sp. TaxID=2794524 RepID=A0A8A4XCF5_9VIRU|nr:MAG: capsid protein [Pavo cristatus parvoviridae sp.]